MLPTNMFWCGRIGGLAIIVLTVLWATPPGLQGQASRPAPAAASQAPAAVWPACGTRSPSDTEIAIDAARMADFKKWSVTRKPGTAITINTYVHVLHDGPEGYIS